MAIELWDGSDRMYSSFYHEDAHIFGVVEAVIICKLKDVLIPLVINRKDHKEKFGRIRDGIPEFRMSKEDAVAEFPAHSSSTIERALKKLNDAGVIGSRTEGHGYAVNPTSGRRYRTTVRWVSYNKDAHIKAVNEYRMAIAEKAKCQNDTSVPEKAKCQNDTVPKDLNPTNTSSFNKLKEEVPQPSSSTKNKSSVEEDAGAASKDLSKDKSKRTPKNDLTDVLIDRFCKELNWRIKPTQKDNLVVGWVNPLLRVYAQFGNAFGLFDIKENGMPGAYIIDEYTVTCTILAYQRARARHIHDDGSQMPMKSPDSLTYLMNDLLSGFIQAAIQHREVNHVQK